MSYKTKKSITKTYAMGHSVERRARHRDAWHVILVVGIPGDDHDGDTLSQLEFRGVHCAR